MTAMLTDTPAATSTNGPAGGGVASSIQLKQATLPSARRAHPSAKPTETWTKLPVGRPPGGVLLHQSVPSVRSPHVRFDVHTMSRKVPSGGSGSLPTVSLPQHVTE